ncbi:MAG TPA: PhoH family protein, partial [Euzebyales bacterium]|nr:PhoH family protein [Euzebyales bacterium]
DSALRIKGSQLGVPVQDYLADTVQVDEQYTGIAEVEVESSMLDLFHRDGKLTLTHEVAGSTDLWLTQCIVLRAGASASGLGRVVARDAGLSSPSDGTDGGTVVIDRVGGRPRVFGVSPRDVRQTFALDMLMDPAVPCVSLMGMAGTGKTFLALAAGLEQVVEAGAYRRLSVYRPLVAVGRQEVGYLPGDLDEKLQPWMAAVYDNLYSLFRGDDTGSGQWPGGSHHQVQSAVDALLDRGQLEMAAITYLRGRSITDEFVIVDEAQNLELPTLKVILTRMAAGSKVVFCGDLSQVDNPYISPFGGMAALIEKLKGTSLFGHVTMAKGVRSPLAELAARTF